MIHLQFLTLAMSLVDAASDSWLTLDEARGCIEGAFPQRKEIISEVNLIFDDDISQDNMISVMDVFDIVTTVICNCTLTTPQTQSRCRLFYNSRPACMIAP